MPRRCKRREEGEALGHVEAVVELAVDDQRGRLEVLDVAGGGPFGVRFRVGPGRALELPLGEPEFLRRAVGRDGVEEAVVRDEAFEAVRVAENPVHHEAAVARAERGLAVLVDEGVGFLRVVEARHEVAVGLAAPVAADLVGERLAVAGRAVGVDHDDDVAVGGEEFGVPAVGPTVAPRALGSAVDEELDRVFLGGVEARGLEQEALDLGVVRAAEGEGFPGARSSWERRGR